LGAKTVEINFCSGIALGTGIFTGLFANVAFGNAEGDKEFARIFTPILGLGCGLSTAWALYLFKHRRTFKAKQDQYFDSMVIRQIFERLSSDKQV